MKSRNMTKKKKNRDPQKGAGRALGFHPPPIERFQIAHSTRLRYTATAAAVNTVITFQNLLDTINMATTATAPFNLFQAVRIRFVEIFGIAALGTPATVSLSYFGATVGVVGDARIHTDTSLGFEPAHLKVKPSARSLASLYQNSGATSAFLLNVPAGSIIDVGLSFIGEGAAGGATAAQNVSVGATVGTIFFRGLDGLAVAGSNFLLPNGIPQF